MKTVIAPEGRRDSRLLSFAAVVDVDRFPEDVVELLGYFREPEPGQRVRAFPGAGAAVEVWILGAPDTVRARLEQLVARTGAEELILTSQIHGHRARLRSYELVAGL